MYNGISMTSDNVYFLHSLLHKSVHSGSPCERILCWLFGLVLHYHEQSVPGPEPAQVSLYSMRELYSAQRGHTWSRF